jgi:hypothetical protein
MFNWNAVSGAVSYIVTYRIANTANTSPSITLTSTTNSVNVTGLNANTYYMWQVQAVCLSTSATTTSISPMSAMTYFHTPSLLLYPNPTNVAFRMTYWVDQPTTTYYEMRDIYGQVVSTASNIATAGSNDYNIDTSSLREGMYFVILHTDSETTINKVLVKH